MNTQAINKAQTWLVILAFAIVYVVWGSTYFFIGMAVHGFPPMLMGAVRFILAGIIMLVWCQAKGDYLWNKRDMLTAAITGLLLLVAANGTIIWVETVVPSAMVAIMVSVNPIWVIVLDRANWGVNFKNKATVYGLVIGFAGVLLLFGESFIKSFSGSVDHKMITGLLLLLLPPIAWAAGSLFSKKRGTTAPARVNTGWQMLIAGFAFIPLAGAHHEFSGFNINAVPTQSWVAIAYLILFGSIAAFSAYVWLLQVRPAAQVSTHSYVNPVIAVLLGVGFGHENITGLQVLGLVVILVSVLLVNLSKYGKFNFRLPMIVKCPQMNKI